LPTKHYAKIQAMSLSKLTAVTARHFYLLYLLQVFVVTTTASWTMNGISGRWSHAIIPIRQ